MKYVPAMSVMLVVMGITCCLPAMAADPAGPRLVSVTGDADVLVAPDEAVVSFSVQIRDEKLSRALSQSDRRVAGVLKAVRKTGVEDRHIMTDHINIWPEWRWDSKDVLNYRVRKGIVVTLKDVSRLERVLKDAIAAGANGVDRVEFRSTKLREHKDRARLMAVRAAREKAGALAAALGQSVGRPHSINEQPSNWSGGGWWGWSNAVAQNAVQSVGPAADATGEITALGQLRINAKVTVSFELN